MEKLSVGEVEQHSKGRYSSTSESKNGGANWSKGDHGLKFRCTWESFPQQDKRSNKVLQASWVVKELCMWMAMPNSGSMEAVEKIGAMCSSASKKERSSWLGGLPPNGRSTSGGGREAVWRLHWLDPTRRRLEKTIGNACGLSRSNWNCQSKRRWKISQREGWHVVDTGVGGGGSRHFLLEIFIASAWGEYQLVFTIGSLVNRGYASQGMDSGVAGTEATVRWPKAERNAVPPREQNVPRQRQGDHPTVRQTSSRSTEPRSCAKGSNVVTLEREASCLPQPNPLLSVPADHA